MFGRSGVQTVDRSAAGYRLPAAGAANRQKENGDVMETHGDSGTVGRQQKKNVEAGRVHGRSSCTSRGWA